MVSYENMRSKCIVSLSLASLILRSMSALDLSLAAKMMQKVQTRKRRKCANDIAAVNNRHFSKTIVYIWGLCVIHQPRPNQADRAEAGNFVRENCTFRVAPKPTFTV